MIRAQPGNEPNHSLMMKQTLDVAAEVRSCFRSVLWDLSIKLASTFNISPALVFAKSYQPKLDLLGSSPHYPPSYLRASLLFLVFTQHLEHQGIILTAAIPPYRA